MIKALFPITIFLFLFTCNRDVKENTEIDKPIEFHIPPYFHNVQNKTEQKILKKWEAFLNNNRYYEWESEDLLCTYEIPYPMLPIQEVINPDVLNDLHLNILGIFPLDSSLYCIQNSLIKQKGDTICPIYQFSVYAKLEHENIRFTSKPYIIKSQWQHQKVGNIDYYFDWNDSLNEKDAQYFNEFNSEIARKFEMDPIVFDYFQCKYVRNVFDVQGYDLNPVKYYSDQTGGMADHYNNIIYAGNGKAIYTHELIHLYSMKKWRNSHTWFDEGLATYLGGSRELPLEKHLTELNQFALGHPDYDLSDIDSLDFFQNDSFDIKFVYNIGGLIIQEIVEKHGFEYLDQVMDQGKDPKDFYHILENSLNIQKENLNSWIRKKISKYGK